jgi:hypothetical protein
MPHLDGEEVSFRIRFTDYSDRCFGLFCITAMLSSSGVQGSCPITLGSLLFSRFAPRDGSCFAYPADSPMLCNRLLNNPGAEMDELNVDTG